MEKRYIGIDLHRNRFTCCIRGENERTYVTEWRREDLAKFAKKLRPCDEVAVEIPATRGCSTMRGAARGTRRDDSQDGADHVDSHRATTYVIGPYVKKNTVISTRYSQPSVLRTIEDIMGTEHINLNTYYTRPMADVFDITSSGDWTFTAVASTLLKQTTLDLGQAGNKVQFAAGPNLKPTHNAQYWAAKTRGFDFSAEDRVPRDLYNKILWEGLKGTPAPVPHTRFQMIPAAYKGVKAGDKDDDN